MPTEADPYDVLGVPRDADLPEVRGAYRRAALSCHPDRYPGDPVAAEKRLRELIAAYKAIARKLDPAQWCGSLPADRHTFTPQDFAREGPAAFWRPEHLAGRHGTGPTQAALGLYREEMRPTRHETWTFAFLWLLAVLLGVAVGLAAAWRRAAAVGPERLQADDVVTSVLYGEAIYVALVAAAGLLVVLTRKVVRLTMDLAGLRWRFLPRPRTDRDLPAHPAGGGASDPDWLPHRHGQHRGPQQTAEGT